MCRPDEVVGIVLHFRTPDLTARALDSLRAEGVVRAVLVDNSEDGGRSLRALDPTLQGLRGAGLAVELVEPGHNLGFAAGVAAGIQQMSAGAGQHALLLNSDAVLLPGALAAMCAMLTGSPIVVPAVCRGNAAPPSSPFDYFQPATGAIWRTRPHGRALEVASGCCMLIRADVLSPQLFDPDFFFYCEDIMLAHTLARQGRRVVACMQATVQHAVSASARKGSLFYEYHMVRAHWLLAWKLAGNALQRCVFLAVRGLVLPARAVLRAFRQRSWTPLRALFLATWDVLRGRCQALTPPAP